MAATGIDRILAEDSFDRQAIVEFLSVTELSDINAIRARAMQVLEQHCGTEVYFRGLVEFSNQCVRNCLYCGIRLGNQRVSRYLLTEDEIVASALWCADKGYGSVVLQSGERHDATFVDLVERRYGGSRRKAFRSGCRTAWVSRCASANNA